MNVKTLFCRPRTDNVDVMECRISNVVETLEGRITREKDFAVRHMILGNGTITDQWVDDGATRTYFNDGVDCSLKVDDAYKETIFQCGKMRED